MKQFSVGERVWSKRDQKYYSATIVENGRGGRYIINHSVMPSEIDWDGDAAFYRNHLVLIERETKASVEIEHPVSSDDLLSNLDYSKLVEGQTEGINPTPLT